MPKKRLLAVGFCCADVYENLNMSYPTGNGVDWGVHLARAGWPVSVMSVVGTDAHGASMRETLEAEGIDCTYLRQEPGDTCIMRMALKDGVDRVHLEEVEGVMATYALTSAEVEAAASFDMLHTDLFGNVLEHLPTWHKAGVTTVMDFSVFSQDPEYGCLELFPHVDHVFMSFEEDTPELRGWMETIKALGPKTVVATLGEKGSLCLADDGWHEADIVPTTVVNTVGAGDSWIAGFTMGLLEGEAIDACMQRGAELSSTVVSGFKPY